MQIIDNKQLDLSEGWIPKHLLELSEELAFADKAFNDPRILKPFLISDKQTGRPSTPAATYLRMMYLKFRYQISYELLVKETADSYKWRKFCHIPHDGEVPDDKTLIKLTKRFGEKAVKDAHDAVVRQAVEAKILRGRKMRVDTTVNESNIHYPTDTGLLADGVRVITRTVRKIKEVVKFKTRFRNRTRSVKRRILRMVKFLRKRSRRGYENLRKSKEELQKIARLVLAQALAVFNEIRGRDVELRKESTAKMDILKLAGLQVELKHWLKLFRILIEQNRTVLGGNTHIPNRLVSIFDTGARPIQKGKLFPRTEFGRKILVQEAEKGIVTDYQIHEGNPNDQSLLDSALNKHEEIFGSKPKELAADRGFYSPGQDEKLHACGVEHVSIPVRGNKNSTRKRTEKSAWFRRLQRWRAGGEAKISLLKRKFGLRKSLLRGDAGTAIWVGWGVIVHNLVQMKTGP